MKNWVPFVQGHLDSHLWAFMALDYYYKDCSSGEGLDPATFVNTLVQRLNLKGIDPATFHRGLLCLSIQLLGTDFRAVMDISSKFLKLYPDTLTAKQLQEISSHYSEFKREKAFKEFTLSLSQSNVSRVRPSSGKGCFSAGSLAALVSRVKPKATPYFISVYSEEASSVARSVGASLGRLPGFSSTTDLRSSEEWRSTIERQLRTSRTVFLIESKSYWTRGWCKFEAAFAVASGKRICRVGCTSKKPSVWLNNWLQYKHLVNLRYPGNLRKLIAEGIESPLLLNARRDAGRQLVSMLDRPYLVELVSRLQLDDSVSDQDSIKSFRASLVRLAFANEALADRTCESLDFSWFL